MELVRWYIQLPLGFKGLNNVGSVGKDWPVLFV
jgi:hypothetical protein